MAEIHPFPGVLYDMRRVRAADVLTQPYDKITSEMRERYLVLSPYNLVRIELGREQSGDNERENRYTRAAHLYRSWQQEGILRRAAQPALYWLEQTFRTPDGSGIRTRRGLIARVRLHRWSEGPVLPHEHTLSKPKADRLALLRAVGAQQGQIFMLHPQSLPAPKLGDPLYEVVDDHQVTNKVWEISDPGEIRAMQAALQPQTFYIADGHHRYETALAFRDELGAGPAAPSAFVMATLVDMNDPGLVTLPTHRAVAHLSGFDPRGFRERLSRDFTVDPQHSLHQLLAGLAGERHAMGMRDALGFALVRPRDPGALRSLFANKPPLWHTLDVALLHVALLESLLGIDDVRLAEEANVTYWREPAKAAALVEAGTAQLAFFLNPTQVGDVRAIADARSRMPQKSTDFYPKLLSGMVMYEVR